MAVKVALDNPDMFAGIVLIAPSFIICPRFLSTSSVAVSIASYYLRQGGRYATVRFVCYSVILSVCRITATVISRFHRNFVL